MSLETQSGILDNPLLFFENIGEDPSFEYREEQKKMADQVYTALQEQKHLCVEAGTGVGKTLAYLLPLLATAVREELRVVVSTDTKSLQTQILEKDLPIIESILGQNIAAEICLGSSNFVCKRRLQDTLR